MTVGKFTDKIKDRQSPTLEQLHDTFFRFFGSKIGINTETIDAFLSSDEWKHPGEPAPEGFIIRNPATKEPIRIHRVYPDGDWREAHLEQILSAIHASCGDYLLEKLTVLTHGYLRPDPTKIMDSITEIADHLYDYERHITKDTSSITDDAVESWIDKNKDRVRNGLEGALAQTSQACYPKEPMILIDGPQKGRI